MKAHILALAIAAATAPSVAANAADVTATNRPILRTPYVLLNQTIRVGNKVLPLPPQTPGCYRHRTAWESVSCVSKEELARIPHPTLSGLLLANSSEPLGYAAFDSSLILFGSETDSQFGNNNFSLQLNVNGFIGNNGQLDTVQFTHEAGANTKSSYVCIWNIDTATQNYGTSNGATSCVGVNMPRGPATGDVASMVAYISRGPALDLIAVLPWTSGGNNGEPDAWYVVTGDTYGLAGNWNYAQGAMLGYGNSSVANFSTSCVTTNLALQLLTTGTKATYAPIDPAPQTPQTQETNNLATVNKPKVKCSEQYSQGACATTNDAATNDNATNANTGAYGPTGTICYPPPAQVGGTGGGGENNGGGGGGQDNCPGYLNDICPNLNGTKAYDQAPRQNIH